MSDPENTSNPFEEAFLNEYPNPDRIGCPGKEILRGLASKKLPISHPARTHIGQCSPCWREFRSFEARIRRTRSWTVVGGIAALLLVLLLGPYLYWWFPGQWKDDPTIAMDLRSSNPTRGHGQQQRSKVHLPARRIRLVVTLPWGSDGGAYEVELKNTATLVLAKARGTAKILDGDTSLTIDRIDLRKIPQGDYVLSFVKSEDRLKTDVNVTVP